MASVPSIQQDVAQAAAIPFRRRGGVLQFCLVNSSGGRWLFPKGTIGNERTALEVAESEALEEAGLRGDLDPEPVGVFTLRKQGKRLAVVAYLLEVKRQDDSWKEDDWRVRQWIDADSASEYLSGQLADIAREARRRLS